jgi:hypothetical protein
MKYHRLVWLLLLTVFALTPKTARAQLWSNPTLVAREVDIGGPAQLVYAPGDTFWLISSAGDTLSGAEQMIAYWNAIRGAGQSSSAIPPVTSGVRVKPRSTRRGASGLHGAVSSLTNGTRTGTTAQSGMHFVTVRAGILPIRQTTE